MKRLTLLFLFLSLPAWSLDLRQSTAVEIEIGPFLDASDGVTPETGLGLADDLDLSKNGDPFETISSASASHDTEGWYRLDLGTSDTDTLGTLVIQSSSSGVHVPVWAAFMVLPSNVWDSLYSTDKLQVDVTQVSGSAEDVATSANVLAVDTTTEANLVYLAQLNAASTGWTTAVGFSTHSEGDVWTTGSRELSTPNNYKADVTGLFTSANGAILDASVNGLEATAENTYTEVAGLNGDAMRGTDSAFLATNGALLKSASDDWATATGFSTHSEGDVWTTGSRELSTPNNYKADVSGLFTAANGAILDASVNGLEATAENTYTEVAGLNGDAMRGTDSAFTASNGSTLDGKVDVIDGNVDDIESALVLHEATAELTLAIANLLRAASDEWGAGSVPSAAAIADQVWDEILSGHTSSGSTGEKLDDVPLSGTGDWSSDEKGQMRSALGVNGASSTVTTDGVLWKVWRRVLNQ